MHNFNLWDQNNTLWMVFSIYFAASVRRVAIKRTPTFPAISLERCIFC